MIAVEQVTMAIEYLDPRELASHPRNVRTDLGDITGLTASIAAQGVIEPLTVVPLENGHQIVAGHRRAAAAIAAAVDQVPCVVRHDLAAGEDDNAGQAGHVGTMLAENLHREGLSAMEEARGVKQMLDLGMPISKVAKGTGLGQRRVKKAIGVARLDDDAAAAVESQQLDLDTAAMIAVYADEPETAATLLRAAERGPGQLAHAVEQIKQTRKVEEQLRARTAELQAAGRIVVESFAPDGARLTRLNGSDGAWLAEKEAEHLSCPGSAVHLTATTWDGVHEDEVCTDWKANGHIDRWASSSASASKPETPEEKEAAKAERRLVIENNKAMAAANTVRRAWVKELLARRSAPPEVLRFAVEEIAANPDALHTWVGSDSPYGDKDADEALGIQTPRLGWSVSKDRKRSTLTSGEHVPDARLPLQLLAHIAGAIETQIQKDSWRAADDRREHLVRWLTFLAGLGYTLSDVEQGIVDGAAK